MTVSPDWGPVRVAWRCEHGPECRPRYCGAGRPVLEWTYARPLPPSSRLPFDDAPVPPANGSPLELPPPIERARPCVLEDIPKAWRSVLEPARCTLAIGHTKSTGKAVRVVRSIVGRGELWRVVLESPPGPPGQGYAFRGGWAATGSQSGDRLARPVGASELKALIQSSSRSASSSAGGDQPLPGGRTVS